MPTPLIIHLNEVQHQRLLEMAHELKLDPSDLAKAAVVEMTSRPAADFARASERTLKKNSELYQRLSDR